uniref:Uncharacterized protein n=1 Tax=Cacopsylla melanoneura TaxID=428564 RepID=A0A8D8UNC8_9HEMI
MDTHCYGVHAAHLPDQVQYSGQYYFRVGQEDGPDIRSPCTCLLWHCHLLHLFQAVLPPARHSRPVHPIREPGLCATVRRHLGLPVPHVWAGWREGEHVGRQEERLNRQARDARHEAKEELTRRIICLDVPYEFVQIVIKSKSNGMTSTRIRIQTLIYRI